MPNADVRRRQPCGPIGAEVERSEDDGVRSGELEERVGGDEVSQQDDEVGVQSGSVKFVNTGDGGGGPGRTRRGATCTVGATCRGGSTM